MAYSLLKQIDACPSLWRGLNANYAKRANFAKTKKFVLFSSFAAFVASTLKIFRLEKAMLTAKLFARNDI